MNVLHFIDNSLLSNDQFRLGNLPQTKCTPDHQRLSSTKIKFEPKEYLRKKNNNK